MDQKRSCLKMPEEMLSGVHAEGGARRPADGVWKISKRGVFDGTSL